MAAPNFPPPAPSAPTAVHAQCQESPTSTNGHIHGQGLTANFNNGKFDDNFDSHHCLCINIALSCQMCLCFADLNHFCLREIRCSFYEGTTDTFRNGGGTYMSVRLCVVG